MKRIEQSVLLAGLLAIALAGCSSSTRNSDYSSAATQGGGLGAIASTSDSGTTASADSPDSTSYGSSAGSSSTASGAGMATATGSPTAATAPPLTAAPNSTVTSIEVVMRQADTSGSTSVGSSGGSTGAAPMGDRIYRITLHLDDGRTQVVTQEWAPSFSTGDRVRVTSGAIQR